ncbi:hypothetical protein H4R20_000534 [Coemansia guatemalensis]|uniref:Uncharacterized protein n=1 Tax=Coemansia guatemalensis TaxID=2761395 RepID=A0A9W8I3P5_9FUNG|nr:hypothetical protein H4R20_000534 [Coemansia guatemalensis]
MATFFDRINSEIHKFIEVRDAEEEVCELYSVYYSTNSKDRLNLVSQTKSELEIDIHSGTKPLNITIDQNPNINGELGQTGAVLWNSSVVMSNFFAHCTKEAWDLTNSNIIELGAGCGLVGITMHNLGAKRVVLTDQPRMMKLLARNTECNRVATKPRLLSKKKLGKDSSTIDNALLTAEYVWGYPPEDPRILAEPIDIVIASDCVYHEDVAMLLSSTLEDMCQSREDVPVVALVGQELRSDLVHQAFVKDLLDRNFNLYRIPVDPEIDRCHALYMMWLKETHKPTAA